MTISIKVYLTALAYKLGNIFKIEDLDELRSSKQISNVLLDYGLEKYSKSQLTPVEMAKESAKDTLSKASIDSKTINALVYTTTSFWNSEFYSSSEIDHLLRELDLGNAYPIGVFFSQCSNLHTAIRTASSLIRTQDCNNILVISTDKSVENGTRLVPPNISVTSDAAASCILSSEIKGDFEIVCTIQSVNPNLSISDSSKTMEDIMEQTFKEFRNILREAMARVNKKPKDFSQIITNNYAVPTIIDICKSVGFSANQIYTANTARFAHAFAADNLINLCDFSTRNSIAQGEFILLMGSGANVWGVTVLHKV